MRGFLAAKTNNSKGNSKGKGNDKQGQRQSKGNGKARATTKQRQRQSKGNDKAKARADLSATQLRRLAQDADLGDLGRV
jgi:hypothetical protein